MSSKEPNDCYVYQPDRPRADGKFYAIAGPGAQKYADKRYTKDEAVRLAEIVNARGKTEPCCECLADYPRADLLNGEIFCKKCRKMYADRVKV